MKSIKIPQKFIQFDDDKSLIIVTGQWKALIYQAHQGQMELIKELNLEKPNYSDREGFVKQSGGQGLTGLPKSSEDYLIKRFISDLSEEVKDLENQIEPEKIYLFAPDYLMKQIESKFSDLLKNKLAGTWSGNYLQEDLLVLLDKMKEKQGSKKVENIKSEARKILDKGNKNK